MPTPISLIFLPPAEAPIVTKPTCFRLPIAYPFLNGGSNATIDSKSTLPCPTLTPARPPDDLLPGPSPRPSPLNGGRGSVHVWECLVLGKRFFDMATPKSELLPVLPMDDVVVLPHMTVTLAVEGDDQKAAIEAARQGSRLILLVARIEGKF